MLRAAITRLHRLVHGEDVFDGWPADDGEPRRSAKTAQASNRQGEPAF